MSNIIASGELNKAFIPIFSDIDHTHNIHNNLIVAAPLEEEHDLALEKLLCRVIEVGLILNPKSVFSS